MGGRNSPRLNGCKLIQRGSKTGLTLFMSQKRVLITPWNNLDSFDIP